MNRFISFFIVFAATLMCCHADMKIITLPDAVTKMGARCLDGSPAAYYFRAASKQENMDKWVLFIQGGGWCYEEQDCLSRSTTELGSSTKMPKTLSIDGLLSEDPTINADFHSWNHVVFGYCDGASFSGAADEPIIVNNTKVYFRGIYNLKAIMQDLLDNHGLNKATQVVLSGDSAGGLATFIHADQIGEMLPNTVQRYKAAPFSGLFLRHDNVLGEPVYESQLRYVYMMQNCSVGVDPRCLLAKSPMYMYLCMFGEETIKSTQTPMFVMNSIYDKWSARCIMSAEPLDPQSTVNGNCTAVPGWFDCIYHNSCSNEQWDMFNTKWGDDFRQVITTTDAFKNRGNGVYAYSCFYHDAEIIGHWTKISVNGVTMAKAFSNWYFSNNEPASKHTYIDCKINGNFKCNPTCSA